MHSGQEAAAVASLGTQIRLAGFAFPPLERRGLGEAGQVVESRRGGLAPCSHPVRF